MIVARIKTSETNASDKWELLVRHLYARSYLRH